MTREEVNKHWDVIVAFKEGKEIEVFDIKNCWRQTDTPIFHINVRYRIKPELKYIPFTFEDAGLLRGQYFKEKSTKNEYLPMSIIPTGVWMLGNVHISYDKLLFNFTFIDGSPCGKLIEE